jgi:hypothetical protein
VKPPSCLKDAAALLVGSAGQVRSSLGAGCVYSSSRVDRLDECTREDKGRIAVPAMALSPTSPRNRSRRYGLRSPAHLRGVLLQLCALVCWSV